jgi:DNA repair exonuclease SbcCD ATPase subunit
MLPMCYASLPLPRPSPGREAVRESACLRPCGQKCDLLVVTDVPLRTIGRRLQTRLRSKLEEATEALHDFAAKEDEMETLNKEQSRSLDDLQAREAELKTAAAIAAREREVAAQQWSSAQTNLSATQAELAQLRTVRCCTPPLAQCQP